MSYLTGRIPESETVVNYTNQSRYMVTTGVPEVNVSYDNQESPSSKPHVFLSSYTEDIVIMFQATVSFYTLVTGEGSRCSGPLWGGRTVVERGLSKAVH